MASIEWGVEKLILDPSAILAASLFFPAAPSMEMSEELEQSLRDGNMEELAKLITVRFVGRFTLWFSRLVAVSSQILPSLVLQEEKA